MPNDAARLVRETVAAGAEGVKLVGAHDLLYAGIGHYAVAHKEKERPRGAQEAEGRSEADTGYDFYWGFCGKGQAGLGG